MARRLAYSLVLLLAARTDVSADFIGLGDLQGGEFSSEAWGISMDGTTVVGQSSSASGVQAFRWTEATGLLGLGFLPGDAFSTAARVSANGSTIVGTSSDFTRSQAFRWTESNGMIGLGGIQSIARDVSGDGDTVVGVTFQTGSARAFRWIDDEGMIDLGVLPGGGRFSEAEGISADGSVIVGRSDSSAYPAGEAFRWTPSSGMTDVFPPAGGQGFAYDVSADGSTIVGASINAAQVMEAYRWTAAEGRMGLGFLPIGPRSVALATSSDGSVVVGYGGDFPMMQPEAFVWSATIGMQDLRQLLINQGDDLTGWLLLRATDVSADGRTIVGTGINPSGQPEAWLARVENPATVPEPTTITLVGGGLILLRWRVPRREAAR